MEQRVCVFKLHNGQELIAKIIGEFSAGWILENVRSIEPQQQPNGAISIALAPYVFINSRDDRQVELFTCAVAARVKDLPEQFVKEYLASTSGLVFANAGSIR